MRREIQQTALWLDKLEGETRERVEKELHKQERALQNFLKGQMPKRTAKRIVERSRHRVADIVAGGGNR